MRSERDPAPLRALRGEVVAMRPRLAWDPWLRGFSLGAVVFLAAGFVLGFWVALSVVETRLSEMERRLTPSGKVYEHGEPVRR